MTRPTLAPATEGHIATTRELAERAPIAEDLRAVVLAILDREPTGCVLRAAYPVGRVGRLVHRCTHPGEGAMSKRETEIHVVSAGSYSDYRVLCACPTKKDAERVAEILRSHTESWHGDAGVEALPMVSADGFGPVPVHRMSVNVWDNGRADEVRQGVNTSWPFEDEACVAVAWRWVRAPIHRGKGGRLDVWGTDAKRVAKVMTDRRAMLLADPSMRAKDEDKGEVRRRARKP